MGNGKDVMVLCDGEEEYARLMTDYLKRHRELPWEIHTYTAVNILLGEEWESHIVLLVVAESAYTEELKRLQPQEIVILNESGVMRWEGMRHINKYQQADSVLRELLDIYAELVTVALPGPVVKGKSCFIGMYSPVRRCMQTSFALTMSRMLSEEGRTLYLNFEHYAGSAELLPGAGMRDLADLLYFLNAEKDKFRIRMQAMVRQMGKLDYVPPMKSGQNLLTVTSGEWMQLLQKIAETGEYDYVILDLTESMQGLFDILRMCTRVFTLTGKDGIAQSKLLQYEQILALYEYEDVWNKTKKCQLPKMRNLPASLEQYTKGDLAEYVRKQIKEL